MKPQTINKTIARESAGLTLEDGRELTCAPQNGPVLGGGNFRGEQTSARLAKSKAFHALKTEQRRDPLNCCRCGRPRDGTAKQCSACKAYQARYRAGKFEAKLTAPNLVAMVKQMRREMDKLQTRFKLWQKAADYRRNLHYRTNAMRKKYHKPVSQAQAMEYLAATSHAYDNTDSL